MILKNSLLYNLETVLNLVFVIYEGLIGNFILSGIGMSLMVLSTVISYIVALKTHLHIYPLQKSKSSCCCHSFFSKIKLFFTMNPWMQILWIYRHNRKNQGLRHFLYYRLSLTYFVSHWIETFAFVILRLSHSAPVESASFIVSVFPIAFNILGIVIATIDWETCKRAKCQNKNDFMLELRVLGVNINMQILIRFVIYISMVTARCLALFILMFSIPWSNPELPYLVYLCHVIIFLFMFGSLLLSMNFINAGNMLKTVVLSLNQTFFNQLDCFLQMPFNFYFIPSYIMNCLSIASIIFLHFLFSSEAWVENKSTKFWVFSAMGISALALYIFAGVLAVLYKRFWCPDVLKSKRAWKFNKITLNEV